MEQSALGNGRLWVLLPTDGVLCLNLDHLVRLTKTDLWQ